MYQRVAPRDFFNEANYIKCLGQISLNLLDFPMENIELCTYVWEEKGSRLCQNEDGNLFDFWVRLIIHGVSHYIFRPLNSREKFPVYIFSDNEQEIIDIFTEDGKFSPELLTYIKKLKL